MAERIARHEPAVARYEALLILDGDGRLAGIITRGDILRALDKDPSGAMIVQEAGKTHLVVTYADELVSEAAAKLLRFDIGRLPVVDRADERLGVRRTEPAEELRFPFASAELGHEPNAANKQHGQKGRKRLSGA